jgi:hypothetical protein
VKRDELGASKRGLADARVGSLSNFPDNHVGSSCSKSTAQGDEDGGRPLLRRHDVLAWLDGLGDRGREEEGRLGDEDGTEEG